VPASIPRIDFNSKELHLPGEIAGKELITSLQSPGQQVWDDRACREGRGGGGGEVIAPQKGELC
jgi:hypothetical protein